MKFEQDRSGMVKPLIDNVTMRAAVFCISLNLFNRCLGRPYNKELQSSGLEPINADFWRRVWVGSSHQPLG